LAVALSNDESKLSYMRFVHALKSAWNGGSTDNMNTIFYWILILIEFGLFVYLVSYKNIQKLQ